MRPVFDRAGSCVSYFVCCPQSAQAAVIDPSRETERYIRMAKAELVKITHVIDTHIHSDHVSVAWPLAREAGARLCMSHSADVKFEFDPVRKGDSIEVGNASLEVLETAGHTKESISLVYRDGLRSGLPWGIFTGDTLFVGDIGRQDLIGAGSYEEMYESLFTTLLSYDDYVEIYPAHYAGSDCGSNAKMSFKSTSTIGFEKRVNPLLQAKTFEEFVKSVTADPPPIPPWFEETKRVNMGIPG